jgi:hypothetical protein
MCIRQKWVVRHEYHFGVQIDNQLKWNWNFIIFETHDQSEHANYTVRHVYQCSDNQLKDVRCQVNASLTIPR